MKVKVKITKEVELKTLKVKAQPRYWDDAKVNGKHDTESGDYMPCKFGSLWCPEIDIETGIVRNWEQGKTAEIHYKVCDCCGWELLDENGDVILSEDDGYVPSTLSPEGEGYGDYIIMDIDKNGKIKDWGFVFSDFENEEY